MLRWLRQENSPRAWLAFQYVFGVIKDKRQLALARHAGQKSVLEIGCSAGIVAQAFLAVPGIQYTGIDVDEDALALARRRFQGLDNFTFERISLSEVAKSGRKFDYILFGNVLHHVDDETAVILLTDVQGLLSGSGTVVILEPEKSRDSDNLVFRAFYTLERGQYRRTAQALCGLIESAGMRIKSCSEALVALDFLRSVKVARFTLVEAAPGSVAHAAPHASVPEHA